MNIKDFRVYIKFLTRNKLYTFVSVVGFSISLAFIILLGMYVRQELSVDNFHEKKDRIFVLTHDDGSNFANPVGQYVKDKFPEVEEYCRMVTWQSIIKVKDSEEFSTDVLYADATFFDMFSFNLLEGKPTEVLALNRSVVISSSFANKHFAGRSPVGLSFTISEVEHTITGVMENMPQNTQFPDVEMIVNYNSIEYEYEGILENWHNSGFSMYFLAKENVDLISKGPLLLDLLKQDYSFFRDEHVLSVDFVPLQDIYFRPQVYSYPNEIRTNSKTLISVYVGIAILILVISILNYVNMTVAQSGFRGKEAALKKLLGCDRKALAIQLLIESFFMTLLTFVLAVFIALLVEPYFNNVMSTDLELLKNVSGSVFVYAILLIVVIAVISGIIPALVISQFNPLEVVKGTFKRKVKSQYSKILIVFQYVVAIALLICSFFMIRQTNYLVNYDIGLNREGIIVMENTLENHQLAGFKDKLYSIAGVELVSYSQGTPFSGSNNYTFTHENQSIGFQDFKVDTAFFRIYGIDVTPVNTGVNAEMSLMNRKGYKATVRDTINSVAVYLGGDRQITGIISDFFIRPLHTEMDFISVRKLADDERPWDISVKISDAADFYKTVELIEAAYRDYNGGKYFEILHVDDFIRTRFYEKEQKNSAVLSIFTLLTIVIMIMGVFAMSMYMIRQKEKEIGLRKVNGATDKEVLVMLNLDSIKLVLFAFVVACPVSYYAMYRWIQNYPYRIDLGWWIFILSGLIVTMLTLAVVSVLTWRASRKNPVESLKSE